MDQIETQTEDHIHCQCGHWSGSACAWHGPKAETVLVDYVPESLRGSVRKARRAGNCPDVLPYERIRVERSCAAWMAREDGEWVREVAP